jgi:hypothetical protein
MLNKLRSDQEVTWPEWQTGIEIARRKNVEPEAVAAVA